MRRWRHPTSRDLGGGGGISSRSEPRGYRPRMHRNLALFKFPICCETSQAFTPIAFCWGLGLRESVPTSKHVLDSESCLNIFLARPPQAGPPEFPGASSLPKASLGLSTSRGSGQQALHPGLAQGLGPLQGPPGRKANWGCTWLETEHAILQRLLLSRWVGI